MNCSCGCCDGLRRATPAAVRNRPGLRSVRARIGTHGSFLETMLARLSSSDYPELAGLRTRDPGDPAVALLDAWAVVADVLTFYQERIANEGYLRTATERRSLVELARLIGYVPRPGVSASVHLAFALEKEARPVAIPKGTKANNIPGPGETMQAFETSEAVLARFPLSRMRPRLVQPQTEAGIREDGLFLKGTATRLEPGDMLLLRVPPSTGLRSERIHSVEVDHVNERTRVRFVPASSQVTVTASRMISALLRRTTRAPSSAVRLERDLASSFAMGSDTLPQLLTALKPGLADNLYSALGNAGPAVAQEIEVYAMRIEARPFGHNAPLQLATVGTDRLPPVFQEWVIAQPQLPNSANAPFHRPNTLYLDNDYEISPETMMVIEKAGASRIVVPRIHSPRHISMNAYGLSGKSVEIKWTNQPWLTEANGDKGDEFSTIRSTRVFLGSERLELADAPMVEDVAGDSIELDGIYEGLAPGRWLIVEGERSDIPDDNGDPVPGIVAAELVMLSGVTHGVRRTGDPRSGGGGDDNGDNVVTGGDGPSSPVPPGAPAQSPPLPGDTHHTVITLAGATSTEAMGLAYRYRRDTVVIHGNVAPATHGETRVETLGSGNAAEALQRFLLKQPPLTYVSARTASGIASTLEVRVNDVLWHEAPTLAVLGPGDRRYTTQTGDDDKTALIFGTGSQGSRLPTGRDNVKARYRSGIGAPGNVGAGQISLLASRPLGVKDVVNPIRAAGGADREGANAIRRNAPIAIMALDRLLSTADYGDFARSFGGIGKASARRVGGTVEVVIAGVDDIPIDETSDVFVNLKAALHRFGDPMVPIDLKIRERLGLVVQAGVRIDPDYLWESLEPKARAAMLAEFAFDSRELGAPLFLAQALRAIQAVRGVLSVDVDVFNALSAAQLLEEDGAELPKMLAEAKPRLNLESHQIAYLSPDVPDTLILQELKP
jgi:Baseplate J-like protein